MNSVSTFSNSKFGTEFLSSFQNTINFFEKQTHTYWNIWKFQNLRNIAEKELTRFEWFFPLGTLLKNFMGRGHFLNYWGHFWKLSWAGDTFEITGDTFEKFHASGTLLKSLRTLLKVLIVWDTFEDFLSPGTFLKIFIDRGTFWKKKAMSFNAWGMAAPWVCWCWCQKI